MNNISLDIEFIKLFVVKDKQQRLIEFAQKPKARNKFVKGLNNLAIFDQRFVTKIGGSERNLASLPSIYKSKGMSGRVYVISENSDWDGLKIQMSYIVGKSLAQCIDTAGFCWKTKTAFYEWHHSGCSYFLSRKGRVQ